MAQAAACVQPGAQAGVRYARDNPHTFVASNVDGFLHALEGCRHHSIEHLVFASSSSVYGANSARPFSEHQSTEHPLSLYATTKKANEQMAHSYARLYRIPCTGLRYFTVYGPCGRPDMALFLFTRAILAREPIRLFNHGRHRRSFTYIDDVVEGTLRALARVPGSSAAWDGNSPDPAASGVAPYRIYNSASYPKRSRSTAEAKSSVIEPCSGEQMKGRHITEAKLVPPCGGRRRRLRAVQSSPRSAPRSAKIKPANGL